VTAYHDRLPYGERVSIEPVLGDPFFPFEGDIQVKPLERPIIPEPPRAGEPGGAPCRHCADPTRNLIWRDEQWSLHTIDEPSGLPMIAVLLPRQHVTLHAMPPELAATLGTMIQRVTLAIGEIDGVARVHFNRFGDGSEHFHLWFLARPLGMMQLRGPMIAAWDDLLPAIPEEERAANVKTVAAALDRTG
jgi:diadenosine tetraphosphate (Ap4A) HIT family hydrolase